MPDLTIISDPNMLNTLTAGNQLTTTVATAAPKAALALVAEQSTDQQSNQTFNSILANMTLEGANAEDNSDNSELTAVAAPLPGILTMPTDQWNAARSANSELVLTTQARDRQVNNTQLQVATSDETTTHNEYESAESKLIESGAESELVGLLTFDTYTDNDIATISTATASSEPANFAEISKILPPGPTDAATDTVPYAESEQSTEQSAQLVHLAQLVQPITNNQPQIVASNNVTNTTFESAGLPTFDTHTSSSNSNNNSTFAAGYRFDNLNQVAAMSQDAKQNPGNALPITHAVDASTITTEQFNESNGISNMAMGTEILTAGNNGTAIAPTHPSVSPAGMAISDMPPIEAADEAINQPQMLATEFGQPDWPEEFGHRITWLATQRVQAAELRLHPAHLGPIEISLQLSNDQQLSAQFIAHNAVVREVIEANLPRLREMMAENGIMLADTAVSADTPQQQTEQHMENGQQSGTSHTSRSPRFLHDAAQHAHLPATTIMHRSGMIDTFA